MGFMDLMFNSLRSLADTRHVKSVLRFQKGLPPIPSAGVHLLVVSTNFIQGSSASP